MQFCSASDHAIFEISNDDGTVAGALCGIAFDEAIVHEAVEAVAAARLIKPQQMIAQQGQFFLLAERANRALGGGRTATVWVAHVKSPPGWPSRRRRILRPLILCVAT